MALSITEANSTLPNNPQTGVPGVSIYNIFNDTYLRFSNAGSSNSSIIIKSIIITDYGFVLQLTNNDTIFLTKDNNENTVLAGIMKGKVASGDANQFYYCNSDFKQNQIMLLSNKSLSNTNALPIEALNPSESITIQRLYFFKKIDITQLSPVTLTESYAPNLFIAYCNESLGHNGIVTIEGTQYYTDGFLFLKI